MSEKKAPLTSENIEAELEAIDKKIEAKIGFYHPVSLLATWFGSGKINFMPGTMGSVAALPFAYLIQMHTGHQGLFIAAILLFFIGIPISNRYMKHNLTSHDPGEIVIDEVAGLWLLLVALPFTLNGYLFGLLLFRIFDIWKPWPISLCDDKVDGGFGVMLDDIIAAIYPVILLGLFAMFCAVTGLPWLDILFTYLGGNAFF